MFYFIILLFIVQQNYLLIQLKKSVLSIITQNLLQIVKSGQKMRQVNTSIRNTSIFKLYDIENNFRRHQQKIKRISSTRAKQQIKKSINSQMNLATQLKKNWNLAQLNRSQYKQRQLYQTNQLLYNRIIKVQSRPTVIKKQASPTFISQRLRTSQSLNRTLTQSRIQQDNQKLMERILNAKSPLSKGHMKNQYSKVQQTKDRLETYSAANKSRMKITLNKINVRPGFYFPEVKSNKNMDPSRFTQNQEDIVRNKHRNTQKNRSFEMPITSKNRTIAHAITIQQKKRLSLNRK